MSANSNIAWCDDTFNIVWGCTPVDGDCKNCYADRLDSRYHADNPHWGKNAPRMLLSDTYWKQPLKWNKEAESIGIKRKVFCSSMGDVFEDNEIVDSQRLRLWDLIRQTPNLIWQILTKRPERIIDHLPEFWDEIRSRVWLGTSIGSQQSIERLAALITPIQSGIKFISLEPLHGEIMLPFNDFVDNGHKVCDLIDWVIVGGESGNETGKYRYRRCELQWIERIVSDCQDQNIPVWVKQMGTHLAKELKLKHRHGADISEFPAHLQIQQFPNFTM